MLKSPARKIHLVIGWLIFLVFLLTGYYMRYHVHDLMESHDRIRFSLRGNHIYILISSLLNLSLGVYLRMNVVRWRAVLQTIGSLLIIAATALLVIAFFHESKAALERPLTLLAMLAASVGTLLHVLSGAPERES